MGNLQSMSSTEDTRPGQHSNDNHNSTGSGEDQDPELQYMRRSLKEDQETFLLNNLLLCMRFFENYEREIQNIRSRPTSRRENVMNEILSRSQKHTLLPGILEEQVSSHVKFSSNKISVEPIQPVHMYVILDNVYVKKIAEIPNGSTSADPISYKLHLEPIPEHVGCVRLRLLEEAPAPKERVPEGSESDLPHIAEGDDEISNEQEDISDLTKTTYTQSTTNLCNDDRNGKAALSRTDGSLSQTNLVYPDEGYQESSGLPEPKLDRPSKQSKQFGTRLQSMQPQHRRSLESMPRSSSSSSSKSGTWGRSSVIYGDSDYGSTASASSITSRSSTGRIGLPDSSSEIPASCFVKKPQSPILREKRTRYAKPHRIEEHSYLASRMFRRYFQKLFVQRLAERLGFENKNDTKVTRKGATIHCLSMKNFDENFTLVTPHEILPCISSEWPDYCSEWLQRSVNAVSDLPNQDAWLTKERMEKVKELGCHIIPVSCSPAGATDPFHSDVEWQLTFPAAERYLETCLSHSQAHVYMMALLLHKAFIADLGCGFTSSHIRHQLFRLLEQNCSRLMWAEDRAGKGLKVLLEKLYLGVVRSQSQPQVADYFIGEKKLFANIPETDLGDIPRQLHFIINNPVLYLITAMRKIRYKPKFYPVMNYKRLYKLLTVNEDDLLAVISPQLTQLIPQPQKEKGRGDKAKTNRNPVFDRAQEIKGDKNSVSKSKGTSYGSATRILDQCAELYGRRLIAVLGMFIEHFTEMARSCYYYGAMEQKDVYLNQAYRLSMILKQRANGKEDAETYIGTIKTLREELSHFARQEGVPGTSAQSDHLQTFSMPFNQFHVDQPSRQETRLFGSHTTETNEFDIHPAPAFSRSNVNSQRTTKL